MVNAEHISFVSFCNCYVAPRYHHHHHSHRSPISFHSNFMHARTSAHCSRACSSTNELVLHSLHSLPANATWTRISQSQHLGKLRDAEKRLRKLEKKNVCINFAYGEVNCSRTHTHTQTLTWDIEPHTAHCLQMQLLLSSFRSDAKCWIVFCSLRRRSGENFPFQFYLIERKCFCPFVWCAKVYRTTAAAASRIDDSTYIYEHESSP